MLKIQCESRCKTPYTRGAKKTKSELIESAIKNEIKKPMDATKGKHSRVIVSRGSILGDVLNMVSEVGAHK